jgi:16S rRNA (cytosine967-C5)-methyltransferase
MGMNDDGRMPADRTKPKARPTEPPAQPPGRAARRFAVFVVDAVLVHRRSLDEAIVEAAAKPGATDLATRDRAFARAIATTTLRRLGRIEAIIGAFLERPLPRDAGRLRAILATAAAQLLFLETPAHAVLSQAVDIVRLDHQARRFDKLVNAVLRRVAAEGAARLAALDPVDLDMPGWLLTRWARHYGTTTARAMATASLTEPALDVSVKREAAVWADRLGGVLLPGQTVRIRQAGRVEDLPGYAEGAWWVQDAAAALPAILLGDLAGCRVADLCAAPGGKTAQLAAAGAEVTAVDVSARRLERLRTNLARLGLTAELVAADLVEFAARADASSRFDAVLLDAPCSATGTIRRHPDLVHTKDERDIARLSARQPALLAAAMQLVRPGGRLAYVTCSLEPEEGEWVVAKALAAAPGFSVVRPDRTLHAGVTEEMITPEGFLRVLPHHALEADPAGAGLDGFFTALLRREG